MTRPTPGSAVAQTYNPALAGSREPANLGDILERVLDRGLVIVGDIRVSLLDIELLTIKLRLLVASVDTARQLGIDWWEQDPWLTSARREPVGPSRREELAEAAAEEEPRHTIEARPTRKRSVKRVGSGD